MTDRVKALTVVLKKDIRIDDVEPLMQAIAMLNGVLKVSPEVSDISDHLAALRANTHVRAKLFALLDELDKG